MKTKVRPGREKILQLLHEIQKKHTHDQFISPEDVKDVADLLMISPAEVEGVISFYKMFSPVPRGRYTIRLCDSLSCRISRSLGIYEYIQNTLQIRRNETTKDGLFTLEIVNCLGHCDTAPNMMVNDTLYTSLDVPAVEEILQACRDEAES